MGFSVSARTVLELGSELISSDIISFYELIKNAFDAKSKSGAEINFSISMRRNEYLKLRENAKELHSLMPSSGGVGAKATTSVSEGLNDLINRTISKINLTPGLQLATEIDKFRSVRTPREYLSTLKRWYEAHNFIEVNDTGSGMSAKELATNFLTLGTSARKKEVDLAISEGASKVPLGEKGIGRLSAMRLGRTLHVETARAEDARLNVLDIDWRAFSDPDARIEDIKIEPILGGPKISEDWHGTRLKISALNEDWTEKRINKLASEELAKLTDPFLDPKTRPRVVLSWNGERIAIPFLERTLLENTHAKITGVYSITNGQPKLTLTMNAWKIGNFEHPVEADLLILTRPDLESLTIGRDGDIPSSALTSIGPFSFEIYWFNRRYLSGITEIGKLNAVRLLLRKWAGIMLFRDGFKVFPYGEEDDDWLSLDYKAMGRTGYSLNKNQFVGRVNISRLTNPDLVDQTNREGLRVTPESQILIEVLHDAITERLWSFFKEIDGRYRKRVPDIGNIEQQINSLQTRAKSALGKLRRHIPKDENNIYSDLEQSIFEFQELSERAQQRIQEVESDSKQMVQMAGIGLLVEMVAHELARSTEGALKSIEGLASKNLPNDVKSKLATLRAEIKSISKRLRVLDEASVPGRQRAETFDLVRLLQDLKEGHAAQFERHQIEMKISGPKEPLRVRLVKGMVVQILENLLSNSIYWLGIRSERERSFSGIITVKVQSSPLSIVFSDNGVGIAPDHSDRIFRPYWSLKDKSKRRGLGLYIAASNANDLKGKLYLSDKPDRVTERLHEFILELPDSAVVS